MDTTVTGTRRFLRAGAIGAIAGGGLFALADLQHLFVYPKGIPFSEASQRPMWIWHQASHMVAIALVLVALPALYLAQSSRTGRFAFGAYLALLVSFAWLGAFAVGITMATYVPGADLASFDQGPPPGVFVQVIALCFPLAFLSGAAFAIASWRAKVLPRPALVLLALSAPLEIIGSGALLPMAGGIAMGIAFTWMGVRVWTVGRNHGVLATNPRPPAVARIQHSA